MPIAIGPLVRRVRARLCQGYGAARHPASEGRRRGFDSYSQRNYEHRKKSNKSRTPIDRASK